MRKRLIAAVFSTALLLTQLTGCSSGGEGMESKVYTIGINQFAVHPSLDNCRLGFIEGLKQEGFEENKNVKYDYQNAAADGNICNQIAQKFISAGYDMLLGIATPSAQACYNVAEEKGTPVIYSAVSDPVKAGLTGPDGGPGKTVTGTSDVLPLDKQVAMIRKFLPDAKRLGILYTTSEVNSESQINQLNDIVPKYGFELVTTGVTSDAEIPQAADSLLSKVDCVNNLTDNTVVQNLGLIIDKANAAGIPVFGSEEEQLKLGCVASESIDYFQLGVQTGKMAARVLKGEDVKTIPFETISQSSPVINKTALAKLGIAIPADLDPNVKNIDTETGN